MPAIVTTTLFPSPTADGSNDTSGSSSSGQQIPIPSIIGGTIGGCLLALVLCAIWIWWGKKIRSETAKQRRDQEAYRTMRENTRKNASMTQLPGTPSSRPGSRPGSRPATPANSRPGSRSASPASRTGSRPGTPASRTGSISSQSRNVTWADGKPGRQAKRESPPPPVPKIPVMSRPRPLIKKAGSREKHKDREKDRQEGPSSRVPRPRPAAEARAFLPRRTSNISSSNSRTTESAYSEESGETRRRAAARENRMSALWSLALDSVRSSWSGRNSWYWGWRQAGYQMPRQSAASSSSDVRMGFAY